MHQWETRNKIIVLVIFFIIFIAIVQHNPILLVYEILILLGISALFIKLLALSQNDNKKVLAWLKIKNRPPPKY